MGTAVIPTVADFLTIEPLTPELVLKIGWLPQCNGVDGKHCGIEPTWMIEADPYCTVHKNRVMRHWKEMIENLITRPERTRDGDLEVLELIRDEFPGQFDIYPHAAVKHVIRNLCLSDNTESRNLASWYLWKMKIFTIHQRASTFEGAE